MIERKNFSGLHTPADIGVLIALVIPPEAEQTKVRVLDLPANDSAYAGRWIVSADATRGWKLRLRKFGEARYIVTDELSVYGPLLPDQSYTSDFRLTDLPELSDHAYANCNFSQPAPVVTPEGKRRGVRLFPGDDTPRTFIECNLCNAEPPPGSRVEQCLTVIKEFGIETGIDEIEIDGEVLIVRHHSDFVYARWTPGGYVDWPTPEQQAVD